MVKHTDYEMIRAKYKQLLNDAYLISKTDKMESARIYAEADQLRKSVYAF